MISVEECREYLKKYGLSDEQLENIRNTLYCISENVIKKYLDKSREDQKKEK